jgi:hypothetical protein
MHCVACGVSVRSLDRCTECGADSAPRRLLGTAFMLWIAALLIELLDRVFLYRYVERILIGLGSAPPAPAAVYFALGRYLSLPACACAVVLPMVILVRSRQLDAWKWSRGYALSATMALAWAVLGLVFCYLGLRAVTPAL